MLSVVFFYRCGDVDRLLCAVLLVLGRVSDFFVSELWVIVTDRSPDARNSLEHARARSDLGIRGGVSSRSRLPVQGRRRLSAPLQAILGGQSRCEDGEFYTARISADVCVLLTFCN